MSDLITENLEEEFKKDTIGIYKISFIPPKDLRIPILPRHSPNRSLIWSNEPFTPNDYSLGYYSAVDIKNALRHNYQITFLDSALIWRESSDTIFTDYVDRFYVMKQEAVSEGQKTVKTIAKLMLNALYGKLLQNPHIPESKIVSTAKEFHEFEKTHEITSWTEMSLYLSITGDSLDKEAKITKPSRYGCFILAHSRFIMLHHFEAIDPTLKKAIFSYADTDSMHISGKHSELLVKKKLMFSEEDAEIGCDDGIILKVICVGPKAYKYIGINKYGKLFVVGKWKGIPSATLDVKNDFYENKVKKYTSIKKIGANP